jgi:phosphoglycerol transferase MdoB-like AlkP superfamily enzyme
VFNKERYTLSLGNFSCQLLGRGFTDNTTSFSPNFTSQAILYFGCYYAIICWILLGIVLGYVDYFFSTRIYNPMQFLCYLYYVFILAIGGLQGSQIEVYFFKSGIAFLAFLSVLFNVFFKEEKRLKNLT